jgi:hypothetical protein
LFYAAYSISEEGKSISIDGTYVLQSRVLGDGTVLEPPHILGLYSVNKGYFNFNLMWKNKDGEVYSASSIGRVKLSSKEYYEEFIYRMTNDEINGKGVVYDFKKESGTSPVKIIDGKIEFMYPIFDDLFGVFDGDKFTATRVDGTYIDNWIKVK